MIRFLRILLHSHTRSLPHAYLRTYICIACDQSITHLSALVTVTHLTIVYSTLWCVERASIIHQHNLANSTSTKCWEPCGADCRWLARLRCRPASHARSCSRPRELPRPRSCQGLHLAMWVEWCRHLSRLVSLRVRHRHRHHGSGGSRSLVSTTTISSGPLHRSALEIPYRQLPRHTVYSVRSCMSLNLCFPPLTHPHASIQVDRPLA